MKPKYLKKCGCPSGAVGFIMRADCSLPGVDLLSRRSVAAADLASKIVTHVAVVDHIHHQWQM